MTTFKRFGRRLAITNIAVGAAVAISLVTGAPAANADILDDIGAKYMQGSGGGHLSNYVEDSLRMRAQGFRPSKTNLEALQAGWDFLPNQTKLVSALQSTVNYQRRLMAQRSASQPDSGPTNKAPAWSPPRGDDDRNQFTDGWDINPYN